jgi:hypothetical protein
MNSIITLTNHSLDVLQAKPKTCNFTHTKKKNRYAIRIRNPTMLDGNIFVEELFGHIWCVL